MALPTIALAVSIVVFAAFMPAVSVPAAVDASAAAICAGSVMPTWMLPALIACAAITGCSSAMPGLPFLS